MHLSIEIKFLCENHGYFGSARKHFETNSLPYEGLKIKDPAWKGIKKIILVSVDYNESKIYVFLEDEIFFEKSMIGQIKELFKESGWEIK